MLKKMTQTEKKEKIKKVRLLCFSFPSFLFVLSGDQGVATAYRMSLYNHQGAQRSTRLYFTGLGRKDTETNESQCRLYSEDEERDSRTDEFDHTLNASVLSTCQVQQGGTRIQISTAVS